MNLTAFLEHIKSRQGILTLPDLKSWMAELELEEADYRPYLNFSADHYQRNLVFRTEHCEVLLLCFEAGQRTPIHDHRGSVCGVKVLQGCGTETSYQATPDGWLYATGSDTLVTNGVVGSQDMDVHQLSNLQPGGQRLATLHVYSPPLGEVGNYHPTDNRHENVKAGEHLPTV